MPRERSPNRDKAFEIYQKHKGNIDLVEIAKQLNLSDGTVRGWKNKDKWDSKLNGTLQKNTERSNSKKNTINKEPMFEAVTEIDNPELTDKQRLFCIYYIKSFNQTMAAIKAGYSPERAHVTGSELVRNSKVREYIRQLKGKMTEELFIDAMDVLNKYVKIAFADMNDFVDFGNEEDYYRNLDGDIELDEEGNPKTYKISHLHFKNSNEVDGTLICEIKTGKQGMSIKLEDRQKALDKLAEYFDLFPDKFKRQIEQEKLKIAQEKLEIDKYKVDKDGKDKPIEIVIKRKGEDK